MTAKRAGKGTSKRTGKREPKPGGKRAGRKARTRQGRTTSPNGTAARKDTGSRSQRGRRPEAARKWTADAPSRRKALVRRLVALFVVLVIGGLAYLVLFTPVLGVRTVEVTGTDSLSADEVREVAGIVDQRPLLRIDTGEIADRV
jgi:cell division protein FtsQ